MADALAKRRFVITLFAIAALAAVGVGLFRSLGKRPPRPAQSATVARPIAVRTMLLKRSRYREVLSGYGRARALKQTSVPAEVTGIVDWVRPTLEAGATVKKGDELVRLDDHDLRQAEQQARARVAAVKAGRARLVAEQETNAARLRWARREVEASRAELKRVQDLKKTKSLTQSDVDRQSIQTSLREATYLQIEGQAKSIEAQLDRNDADLLEVAAILKTASKDLERAIIKAPWTGRIISRNVHRGARVVPGTSLVELIDPEVVEIAVALPAGRYGLVESGAEARVFMEGRERFSCKVARIAPVIDSEQRTFFVYLELTRGEVAPGAFVTAEIDGPVHEDVFVLPRTAFVGDRIFIAKAGVAHARTPESRLLLPEVMLAVGGVHEGERLIVTNLEEVADGTRVASVANEDS